MDIRLPSSTSSRISPAPQGHRFLSLHSNDPASRIHRRWTLRRTAEQAPGALCLQRGRPVFESRPRPAPSSTSSGAESGGSTQSRARIRHRPGPRICAPWAERQNPQWRYDEIAKAVAEASPCPPAVAVVPVRMTEAWLLLDEETLRKVAGRPRSTVHLNLPPPSQLEACPDPKSVLREVLDLASGLAGRRLRRFRERFGENRRSLAMALRQLPSWQALEDPSAIVTPLQGPDHAVAGQALPAAR